MTNPPPTLLTIPAEIRSEIFHLALLNTPEICEPDPPFRRSLDLSLLFTNRQIYHETRAIPLGLHYFSNQYDPQVNFLSSLRLCSFQIAALKILGIDYLNPSDLKQFLSLGSGNGFVFGEMALNLDLLLIYADDWIASGARRWRCTATSEDVQYGLPKSSRWLRALCGLRGWKVLEVAFKSRELVSEYWDHGGFMQPLFDDFRSHSEDLDEDFTIWHESQDVPIEKIIVLRTNELMRFKQQRFGRRDLEKLMEGKECVVDTSVDRDEDEEPRPAFHVQERCWGLVIRKNHCTACRTSCQSDCRVYLPRH